MKSIKKWMGLLLLVLIVSGCGKINRFISTKYFDGGTRIILFVESQEETGAQRDKVIDIIKLRLREMGVIVKKGMITKQENAITLELPFTKGSDLLVSVLAGNADFNLRVVSSDNDLLERAKSKDVPKEYDLIEDDNGKRILVNKKIELKGSDIERATMEMGTYGLPVIGLKFNAAASKKFFELTKKHLGQQVAVLIDGRVKMAPKILEVIPGGRIQITGHFTKEEVERFVILINTRSYPVPVRIDAVGKVFM